jgi:hypothetical protein
MVKGVPSGAPFADLSYRLGCLSHRHNSIERLFFSPTGVIQIPARPQIDPVAR